MDSNKKKVAMMDMRPAGAASGLSMSVKSLSTPPCNVIKSMLQETRPASSWQLRHEECPQTSSAACPGMSMNRRPMDNSPSLRDLNHHHSISLSPSGRQEEELPLIVESNSQRSASTSQLASPSKKKVAKMDSKSGGGGKKDVHGHTAEEVWIQTVINLEKCGLISQSDVEKSLKKANLIPLSTTTTSQEQSMSSNPNRSVSSTDLVTCPMSSPSSPSYVVSVLVDNVHQKMEKEEEMRSKRCEADDEKFLAPEKEVQKMKFPTQNVHKLDMNSLSTTLNHPSSSSQQQLRIQTMSPITNMTGTSASGHQECWICYDSDRSDAGPLIQPCSCKGDVSSVHHDCLKQWLMESTTTPGRTTSNPLINPEAINNADSGYKNRGAGSNNPSAIKCHVCNEPYTFERSGTVWLPAGLTTKGWLKTAIILSIMSITAIAFWYTVNWTDHFYVRIIGVGLTILVEYICLRFLGFNMILAYNRAKVAAYRITGRTRASGTNLASSAMSRPSHPMSRIVKSKAMAASLGHINSVDHSTIDTYRRHPRRPSTSNECHPFIVLDDQIEGSSFNGHEKGTKFKDDATKKWPQNPGHRSASDLSSLSPARRCNSHLGSSLGHLSIEIDGQKL